MIQDLGRLVKVELFKTARARLGRIALFSAFIGGMLPIILIGIIGDRRASTFPGVVPQVLLPSLTVLTGLVSLLLSLSSWGDEYEHGTLRLILSRSPERWRSVLAKTAASALALLAIIVVALAAELIVAALSHLLQAGPEGLVARAGALIAHLLPVVGIWWLAGMVYTGVVALAVTGGGSPTLGMIAGLGFFLGDLLLSNLGPGGAGGWAGEHSIINSTTCLISGVMGPGGELPFPGMVTATCADPGGALSWLILCTAGTLLLATLVFHRRDVHP